MKKSVHPVPEGHYTGPQMRLGLGLLCCALLPACGDDSNTVDPSDDTGTTTSATMMPMPSTSSGGSSSPGTGTSDPPDDSSGTGFDPADPECGNGFVEGDEQCDDANDDDTDECTNMCQLRCGLSWVATIPPPTGESEIDPRGLASDPDDNTIVVGFLREITSDQEGNETAEPDVVVAASIDPDGAERWSTELSEDPVDVVVAAVTTDAQGDVLVAATVDAVDTDRNIMVYKLAAADGEVLWTHAYDSAVDSSSDEATGIAVGPDGDPVVTGTVAAGENDDDVWVRKLDGDTGDEQWTETWSGVGNEVFSVDNGGPVAIGPDGTIYVFGTEYVTFNVAPAVLFRFEVDGGPPTWAYSPTLEDGTQEYEPIDVGVDSQGEIHLTFRQISGVVNTFVVQKIDDDRNELWSRDHTTFETGEGDSWSIAGASPSDGGWTLVTGEVRLSAEGEDYFATWVARLADDGETICQVHQQGPEQDLLPASLRPRAVRVAADGGALVAAQLVEQQDETVWVGRFLAN